MLESTNNARNTKNETVANASRSPPLHISIISIINIMNTKENGLVYQNFRHREPIEMKKSFFETC